MAADPRQLSNSTGSFYDRIADVHHLTLKLSGYRESVARFLRSLDLKIDDNSLVLDSGSGTGIVTMALHEAGFRPKRTVAFDLSRNSLELGRGQARKEKRLQIDRVDSVQGNVLAMPFADNAFDVVLSCGVLEYVPLEAGLCETARVLRPGGKMVLLPVKPSLVGSVLKILYNFTINPLEDVRKISQQYFKIVGNYRFPIAEPIGWSKAIFLLEKK